MADEEPPGGDPQPTADDVASLKEALRKERDAARANAKTAKGLQDRLQSLEDADKTETQKLRDALAERDAQLSSVPGQARQQAVRFASEAARQGFLDPEDAFAFLPPDVDLDDSAAVKKALEDLSGRKPHLVRAKAPTPKVPTRPTVGKGDHLGSPAGDASAKERAAEALRAYRNAT